ncbi:MAG: CDP-alcohol phosphatidyltransferase family protein [Bacilli bacterium]|nr:CDP-alcohol phosphatidyltransferase family protein [Bacilli bacterium]
MKKLIRDFCNEFMEQVKDIRTGKIKKQIPNILTFSRALAPFVIIPTIMLGNIKLAIIELIFFAITDFLDGKLARKFNVVSEFGIKLDAVCDKIFAMSLVIPAVFEFPILIFNLIMEFAISYTNISSEVKGNSPRTTIIGKIKTTVLSITLILIYIPDVDFNILFIASIITLIFQVITLVSYINIDANKDKSRKKTKKH